MANAALMIEWGMPKDGREYKALEEFTSQMRWFEDLKKNGKIGDFHSFGTLTGDLTRRSGFVIALGTKEQIQGLQQTEEYRVNTNRIASVVDHTHVTMLETGDEMVSRMQRFGSTLKKVIG